MEESGNSTDVQSAEAQELSLGSRIVNLFFSPGQVFASVNRSVSGADWLVPLVITALVGILSMQFLQPVVVSDARAQLTAQLDQNPNLSDEQRERALAGPEKMAGIMGTVGAVVMAFLMAVVLALVFMAFTNFLFGGEATFKKSLAVTSYCSLISIPQAIVTIPLALSMGTLTVQFGPGLLLPESMSGTFIYHLLGNLNLFMVWQGALAAIGMGIISGTGTKRPAIAIFALFAVYLIVIAWARSAFGA